MTRLLLVECPGLAEDERAFARLVEALAEICPWIDPVRPGVCTLPIKGPARYFGGEPAVLARVAEVVGAEARRGVAEGLFAAGLAARAAVVVPAGGTPAFLASWPLSCLGEPELAEVLVRLGVRTLGDLAGLPTADVLARFGTVGARCHRVARGDDGELPGLRVPGLVARLAATLGRDLAIREHQPGFWGGASAADGRAAEVLTALQRRLGHEAVLVPVLVGGRGPSDRCRLVPWHPDGAEDDPDERLPWPGRLPPPAPARVYADTAELVDEHGAAVGVTGRGLLTARPDRLSVAGGAWAPVAGWGAPWPVEEWRAGRRAARLQVATAGGEAYLLLVEGGRWRTEAVYD
ncbi:MAG: hypothetical protein ACRDYZ_03935 [Acidimicrobiales bacterium]